MTQAAKATARWDTTSDSSNPGWVVDIELLDGTMVRGLPPAPTHYHDDAEADPEEIARATARYEGYSLI